jgi:hypothetical protein
MGSKIKIALAVAVLTGIAASSEAQSFKNIFKDAKDAMGTKKGGSSGTSSSQSEIAAGLREALQVGAQNATGKIATVNGFFGNSLIKILMPPEAKKVETTLRTVGLGAHVDKAILSMNRAAEDASTKALPIFVNAIKAMTITDAVSILKGSNDAATQYLKTKTTTELTNTFRPIVQQSLDKVNATRYWAEVFTIYNKLPTTREKVNPDLVAYVTERALNGAFVYIAQEEAKIRQDPAARVTDLLKKVFGGK